MADQRFSLDAFMQQHRLPPAFAATADQFYIPLCDWMQSLLSAHKRPGLILGINGAQGTGKTTLSNFIARNLAARFGRNVVELSIDDIYLTRAERQALADRVHPLLLTRGVPGTHDVALGLETLDALRDLAPGATMAVPRFDKAQDDRCNRADWPVVTGPVDLIIFEGWCVGSVAEPPDMLSSPANTLEANEDPDGRWRQYVNDALKANYPALFERLDRLAYVAAPDFDAVFRWRREQEKKLRDRTGDKPSRVFSDEQVDRFVHHFERVTRHNFATLPGRADATLQLAGDHRVTGLRIRKP